tara:strand:+ start:45 stop:716 length:672 start_codon:yes stop_codon:yes gene_type:complete
MAYEFINEVITEARYIRNVNDTIGRDATDIGESFFEQLLMMQQLKFENPKAAKKYATDTLRFGNFSNVKPGATDLHNLAAIIQNPDKYAGVTSGGAVGIDEIDFKRYLRNIINGKDDPALDRKFLLAQQKKLKIKSPFLKSARRLVGDYARTTHDEKQLFSTRMINSQRQDGKFKSDITGQYAKTIDKKGLTPDQKKPGLPLWAKVGALAAAGYALGKSNITG